MNQFAKEILPVNLEDEMKQSYLDYAMSVIVGRALPDVRDGLKPVHRRSLYAMSQLGNEWNKPYKKSARAVGEILGKLHPHGETSVYDAIVRMAQPFSLRYLLVDGQGNFGSIDGDSAAAMRYTEVRMTKLAHEMLADIDKETVDFVPNYDGSEMEPAVLPARIPNLLINGSSGIAVGMATNVPPHNLCEIIDACLALLEKPDLTAEELMRYIPGPDFPTGALINGSNGILEGYRSGRGKVYIRARATIQEENGKSKIIVTELPYQVNKARLLEKIAELVKERRLEGITELRDESDKEGIRVVIELRRGETAEVVLNNLYQHTQLQTMFGINMVALVEGQPRTLSLKQLLDCFIRHRREVVTRRTLFELRKAKERAHILEGLAIALSHIDAMIALIKTASTLTEARHRLLVSTWAATAVTTMLTQLEAPAPQLEGLSPLCGIHDNTYRLSEAQVQAILDLRLHRLTALEQDKIFTEYRGLLQYINELRKILDDNNQLLQVIRCELLAIRAEYGDVRRTEIIADTQHLSKEDLISEEEVVVTLSHEGYIKAQAVSSYAPQRRGGKGKIAAQVKEEDFIDNLFVASTHETLLCFSSHGRVYWLKVYELPQASRIARGKPIINLLPLQEQEKIHAVLPVREFAENRYVLMATALGTVKKTPLIEFSRPRTTGIVAIKLDDDDQLIGVDITDGQQDVMLFSRAGKAVRFQETMVRSMGRSAHGVRGIHLAAADRVIALIVTQTGGTILTVTVNGFGKRTPVEEYTAKGRGTQGVITIKTSERNGEVVGAVQVQEEDDVMLISNRGTLVRIPVSSVRITSRNAQGVRMIRLAEDEQLVGIEKVVELATSV